jgi:hypothetical protein
MRTAFILLMFMSLFTGGCTINQAKNSPTPTLTSTLNSIETLSCYPADRAFYDTLDLPEYILSLWPAPGCAISLGRYSQSLVDIPNARGIGVDMIWATIDELSPHMDLPPVSERVYLYLDGSSVLTDTMQSIYVAVGISGRDENGRWFTVEESPGIISWGPTLNPGMHIAKVIIKNNVGDVFELTWSFTLTDH